MFARMLTKRSTNNPRLMLDRSPDEFKPVNIRNSQHNEFKAVNTNNSQHIIDIAPNEFKELARLLHKIESPSSFLYLKRISRANIILILLFVGVSVTFSILAGLNPTVGNIGIGLLFGMYSIFNIFAVYLANRNKPLGLQEILNNDECTFVKKYCIYNYRVFELFVSQRTLPQTITSVTERIQSLLDLEHFDTYPREILKIIESYLLPMQYEEFDQAELIDAAEKELGLMYERPLLDTEINNNIGNDEARLATVIDEFKRFSESKEINEDTFSKVRANLRTLKILEEKNHFYNEESKNDKAILSDLNTVPHLKEVSDETLVLSRVYNTKLSLFADRFTRETQRYENDLIVNVNKTAATVENAEVLMGLSLMIRRRFPPVNSG